AEKSTGFDALGNFIGAESSGGILDVTELERSLSEVRSYLQEAVDDSRDMPSLKELALSLLKHVNTVKLEREKIISVDVGANPLPLHLICLKYGLSHDYAERILKINPHVSNPNFVTGEVNIYAG
ncbi:MAG: hypothetical protein Q8J64_00425, partial [Thermodesulfovibrionales bacterium]|nr:hypothetical protein [Thermodesulfovibrionales bacterium]